MRCVSGATAAIIAVLLLLLPGSAHAQRVLNIANIVSPRAPLFVFSETGQFLVVADPESSIPYTISSSSTVLFFSSSSGAPRCKLVVDSRFEFPVAFLLIDGIQRQQPPYSLFSATAAAVVMTSLQSTDGSCAGSLVFNADDVDTSDIGMNRARVAMTSDVPPLQAFYGQSSYIPVIQAALFYLTPRHRQVLLQLRQHRHRQAIAACHRNVPLRVLRRLYTSAMQLVFLGLCLHRLACCMALPCAARVSKQPPPDERHGEPDLSFPSEKL